MILPPAYEPGDIVRTADGRTGFIRRPIRRLFSVGGRILKEQAEVQIFGQGAVSVDTSTLVSACAAIAKVDA